MDCRLRSSGNNIDNDNVRPHCFQVPVTDSQGRRFVPETKELDSLLEVIGFELKLSANLMELTRYLEQKTYRISLVCLFLYLRSQDKRNPRITLCGQVVQYCICDEILVTLRKMVIKYVQECQLLFKCSYHRGNLCQKVNNLIFVAE